MTTATITPEEFEKAVRLACVKRATADTGHRLGNPFIGNDEHAVRYGPFLIDIAKQAGLTIPQTRRRMKALQADGRLLRDDSAGGRTRWWLVGLVAELRPAAVPASAPAPAASAPVRQTVTHVAVPARQHWSDVLGVPRDCSTSDARQAFTAALAAVPEHDLDAEQQRQRIRDAYNARLTEDGISEYE